jgi:glycosyltransferase involved in cell wall biosynthesis
MHRPKVSIIVPVYNVEKYLRKCLDSIINQTEKSIEIILVNDGSTDGSSEILQEYEKIDNRIKIFNKKNGGVSSARNIGLNASIGDYITFVDADDWIDENMVELLLNGMELKKAEFSACRYKIWDHYNTSFTVTKLHQSLRNESVKQIYISVIKAYAATGKGIPYGGCAKMFNRYIIDKYNLRFEEGIHLNEDVFFIISYFNCISTAFVIDEPLYNVTNRPNSATKKYHAYELDVHIEAKDRFIKLFSDKNLFNNDISKMLDIRLLRFYLSTLINQFSGSYDMSTRLRIQNTIKILENEKMRKLMILYKDHLYKVVKKGIMYNLILPAYYFLNPKVMAIYIALLLKSRNKKIK